MRADALRRALKSHHTHLKSTKWKTRRHCCKSVEDGALSLVRREIDEDAHPADEGRLVHRPEERGHPHTALDGSRAEHDPPGRQREGQHHYHSSREEELLTRKGGGAFLDEFSVKNQCSCP